MVRRREKMNENQEKYKIGQFVSFIADSKQFTGKVIRRNKLTLTIEVNDRTVKVPYPLILKENEDSYEFVESDIETQEQLEKLLSEVIIEHLTFFKERAKFMDYQVQKLLNSKVHWNKQETYYRGGTYKRSEKEIMVSITFKKAPIGVIKHILFHELLHVKFRGHPPQFRDLERESPWYNEFKRYSNVKMTEVYMKKAKAGKISKPKPRVVPKEKDMGDIIQDLFGDFFGE